MSPPTPPPTTPPGRHLLTVEAAAARLAVSRSTMFNLIKSGAIESVKVGNLRRVLSDAITAYISQLPPAHPTTAG